MKFRIVGWEPKRAGSLYGRAQVTFDDFLTITLPIRDGKNGLWAALPSSKWADFRGKDHFDKLVEFTSKETHTRFQAALIAALMQKYPNDFADIRPRLTADG